MNWFKEACVCGLMTCHCEHLDKPVKVKRSPTMIMNKAQFKMINDRIKLLELLVKDQAALLHIGRAKCNTSQYEFKKERLELKRRRDEAVK